MTGTAPSARRKLPQIILQYIVLQQNSWRRERDSNPRRAFDPYTLSRGAPSTTRPSLRCLESGCHPGRGGQTFLLPRAPRTGGASYWKRPRNGTRKRSVAGSTPGASNRLTRSAVQKIRRWSRRRLPKGTGTMRRAERISGQAPSSTELRLRSSERPWRPRGLRGASQRPSVPSGARGTTQDQKGAQSR